MRVHLGVPGLDSVFYNEGISPGSLILIVGPPGSGKTRLSMQLLAQLQPQNEGVEEEDKRPTLFLTCDEKPFRVSDGADPIWPEELRIQRPRPIQLQSTFDQELRTIAEEFSRETGYLEDATKAQPDLQHLARTRAVQRLVEDVTRYCWHAKKSDTIKIGNKGVEVNQLPSPSHYSAICVDGLLNLAEVRGVSSDERRNALYVAAQALKTLLRSSISPPITAILTMEAGADQESSTPQTADYLADIVLRVGVNSHPSGVRRRYIEITKARYAKIMLGEHSLRIISRSEVEQRKRTHATLGWNRALKKFYPGIIVYPRYRWRPEPSVSPLPESLAARALEVREVLSKIKLQNLPNSGTLDAESRVIIKTIAKIVRNKPLNASNKEAFRKAIESLDVAIWEIAAGSAKGKPFKYEDALQIQLSLKDLTDQICDNKLNNDGSPAFCRFGIRGLDEMFGASDGVPCSGVVRGNTTVLIGQPGTGKSTLATSFMLSGLVEGDSVLFLSFDERYKRILKQIGALTVETANGERSETLAEVTAEHIVYRDGTSASSPKLWFIHEHPVNTGLDELMVMLEEEIGKKMEGSNSLDRRRCRLVIDSLSDLQRNISDPLIFNAFVATLLKTISDWEITTLLVLETGASTTDQQEDTAMSHLADNVVILKQVRVGNVNRKCVAIQKARGRQHDRAAAELVFRSIGDTIEVDVCKGFEGMSDVLSGTPKPAKIELRLFHENSREELANKSFVKDINMRYGDRLNFTPFTLAEARRAFWRQEEGRDIRPDADVTVLALDEPWVRIHAMADGMGHSFLSRWDPEKANPSQQRLVAQMPRDLLRRAEIADSSSSESEGVMRSLLAIPHYIDMGLLLRRDDLLDDSEWPTHWQNVGDIAKDRTSFETIMGRKASELRVPALAFNTRSKDTTTCFFIEMCWNFGATQDFLRSGKDRREHNLDAATEAMAFLARLKWADLLPYPCNWPQTAKALYVRAWYANIPTIIGDDAEPNMAPEPKMRLKPVPFLLSAQAATDMSIFNSEMQSLKNREIELKERIKQIQQKVDIYTRTPHAVLQRTCYPQLVVAQDQSVRELRDVKLRLEQRSSPQHSVSGRSCSGAWYLGVVSSGGNTNVGWSIVEEILDPQRIEKRAMEGGGLPATDSFYRDHGSQAVPGLTDVKFSDVLEKWFPETKPRESVLGIGLPANATINESILSTCREMPEIIHDFVRTILQSPESNPKAGGADHYRVYIREKMRELFDYFHQATMRSAEL